MNKLSKMWKRLNKLSDAMEEPIEEEQTINEKDDNRISLKPKTLLWGAAIIFGYGYIRGRRVRNVDLKAAYTYGIMQAHDRYIW